MAFSEQLSERAEVQPFEQIWAPVLAPSQHPFCHLSRIRAFREDELGPFPQIRIELLRSDLLAALVDQFADRVAEAFRELRHAPRETLAEVLAHFFDGRGQLATCLFLSLDRSGKRVAPLRFAAEHDCSRCASGVMSQDRRRAVFVLSGGLQSIRLEVEP